MADVAVQPALQQTEAPPTRWSLARRIGFRFICCYWVLYILGTGILEILPGGGYIDSVWQKPWHAVVPWIATHIFGVTGQAATYFRTGSGDTTLAYVTNLLYLVVALAGDLLWSALDRRRLEYHALSGWLRLLVRYSLALTLWGYGFDKVFPLQFRPPMPGRLIEQWGDFSPMGAVWSFMGASIPYIMFSGSAEVLGGTLLLFRRTATLGAMVSFTVLANVVALNFCYDVPVKLYSSHLLLMAAYLAASDFRRLANALVLNRPAPPAEFREPVFQRRRWRIAATAFWILFVGYSLYDQIHQGWKAYQSMYVHPQRPPLYGVYDVESGPAGWKKAAVSLPANLLVRMEDDTRLTIATAYSGNAVVLDKTDRLVISRPDSDHVVLEGQWKGAPATIRLKRIDTGKFLLLSRGFHWINEMPFNR